MAPPPIDLPSKAPTSTEKLWAILCHLSWFISLPFILPLIVYLVLRGESAYVAANAREALNFHLSIFIYMLCCIPLVFVVVGVPMMIVLWGFALIMGVVAAVKASDNGCYRYPMTLRLIA